MRALVSHRRAVTSAILAASVAVLAACGAKAAPQPSTAPSVTSTPPATQPERVKYAPGTVLISDGTDVVTVGDKKVRFPTAVKDAVWSPDGSRIAFIDGDGRVTTARPDGTSLVRPPNARKTTRHARPTWFGSVILASGSASGRSEIVRLNAADSAPQWHDDEYSRFATGSNWPAGSVADPSATVTGWNESRAVGYVAYEHGDEVWVLDYNQREPFSVKIADGSEPAISPDGAKVAFVGRNGQVQVAPVQSETHPATPVTFGAAAPSRLVWTQDGARIAYSTPDGVRSVAAVPAGSSANPATPLTSRPGSVSYLAGRTNRVERVAGDPVTAAIRASQLRWPIRAGAGADRGPAGAVVLASAAQPDQALAASHFVRMARGPLLLTSGPGLDPAVRDEIKRVLGKVDGAIYEPLVYLIGDISPAAESELRTLGYPAQRFTGTPSEVTAAAMQQGVNESVMVLDESDRRLTALALATARMPVLLSSNGKLPAAARAQLTTAAQLKLYAIGDSARAAVQPRRIDGPSGDWFQSSVGVAQRYFGCPASAVIVDSSSDTAILAVAISLAVGTDSPLLFAGDSPAVYLGRTSGTTDAVYVVGSASGALVDDISRAIS